MRLSLEASYKGDDLEAIGILDQYLSTSPEDSSARTILAESLVNAGDYERAREEISKSIGGPKAHELLADILYGLNRGHEAAEELRLAANYRNKSAHSQLKAAHALINLGVPKKNHQAFVLAKRATQLNPLLKNAWLTLATVSMYTDQWEEAKAAYLNVLKVDEANGEARKGLASLLARLGEPIEEILGYIEQPNEAEAARNLLNNKSKKNKRQNFSRFPSHNDFQSDLATIIKKHVANEFLQSPPSLNQDANFVTFGSCFAANIATELNNCGRTVWHMPIGEDINNTFTNRFLFEWVSGIHPDDSEVAKRLNQLLGFSRTEVFNKIREADCLIYTLGLGAAFFDRESNTAVIPNSDWVGTRILAELCDFKTATINENVDNINSVIIAIKSINPKARLVLTISPIPLLATFERSSAIIADCVSKSTLRVAVNEIMNRKIAEVYYWPSFEAVKWISPHVAPFFGGEDGVSRHVSSDVIKSIISVFSESLVNNQFHA